MANTKVNEVLVKTKLPRGIRFPVLDEQSNIIRMIVITGAEEDKKNAKILLPLSGGYGSENRIPKSDWDYVIKQFNHIPHLHNGNIVVANDSKSLDSVANEMINEASTGAEPYDISKSKRVKKFTETD